MTDQGLSRGDVLFKGALAVGALYGSSMVGPYVRRALAAGEGGDVESLNFLLRFEYLQAELYDRGRREVNDKKKKLKLSEARRALIRQLAGEEIEHVEALKATIKKLGGKVEPEGGEYAFAFIGPYVFLSIAENLERSAIGAYNGVIPTLKSKAVQELAGSIVQVEGRHAAAVALEKFEEPAPEAFEIGKTKFTSVSSVLKFTGEY